MQTQRARTAGTVKVHNQEYMKTFVSWKEKEKKSSKDDSYIPYKCSREKSVNRSLSSCHIRGWLSEQSIKNVQEKTDYESSEIKNMYISLLENEKTLQQDLDLVLANDIVTKRRKIHLLLKKWDEQTYCPLDKKICEEINSESYIQVDKEKRNQYTRYLNHRNKKGHVFLDIYEKEEYNPLYLNSQRPGPIKAVTEKLADPLLQQQHKQNEEDRVVSACNDGIRLSDKQIEAARLPPLPLVPLGRHGTECSTWLEMKLTDIQSDVRLRSQERLYGLRNRLSSSVPHVLCNRRQFPEKYDTTVKLI